jgi:hypothetical protein
MPIIKKFQNRAKVGSGSSGYGYDVQGMGSGYGYDVQGMGSGYGYDVQGNPRG